MLGHVKHRGAVLGRWCLLMSSGLVVRFCMCFMHMEHTRLTLSVFISTKFWYVKSVPSFFSPNLLTNWLILSQCCKPGYVMTHIYLSHLLGKDHKTAHWETNVKRKAAKTLSLAENLCTCYVVETPNLLVPFGTVAHTCFIRLC